MLLAVCLCSGAPGAQAQANVTTASSTAQFLQALSAALRGARDGTLQGSPPGAVVVVSGNLTLGNSTSFASVPGTLANATEYSLNITGSLPDAPAALPMLDTSRRSGLVVPTGTSQSLLLSRLSLLNG